MIRSDLHTHTTFSGDGKSTLAEMAAAAKEKGLCVLGISEHVDADSVSAKLFRMTDVNAYFSAVRKMQREEREGKEKFTLLAGAEFGYSAEPQALEALKSVSESYHPDYVINSVHIVNGNDCYRSEYFAGKSKQAAYAAYLETVLESLDAPYYYDIVGHIGYVSRKAPYPDGKLRYEEFRDLYDAILKKMISKGKILEVNTSTRGAGSGLLPDSDVLSRYFGLGGRLISFGSDAHSAGCLAEKRELAEETLRRIGFTHIAVPAAGRIGLIPF